MNCKTILASISDFRFLFLGIMYIFFLPLIHQDYIGEQRQVKQFHFTAWPDMGLPESPTPLLLFMQRAKDYNPIEIQGPTIVHCR